MAGPASHNLAALEVVLVDGLNHVDHHAGSDFSGGVSGPIDLFGSGILVAIRTVELQSSGHDSHGLHEIVDGNSFESLNVFEDLFRHERPLLRRSLSGRDS